MATIRDMAILVVDDDQAVRDSLRRALALQGYDVELAGDGEEALFKLRANPHATDLLVVDGLMPRLDGLERPGRLAAAGREVPVLTRSVIFDRVWGYDFGYGSNSLDVYISYLRKKTEAGGKPRLIHTVRGVGYALREP